MMEHFLNLIQQVGGGSMANHSEARFCKEAKFESVGDYYILDGLEDRIPTSPLITPGDVNHTRNLWRSLLSRKRFIPLKKPMWSSCNTTFYRDVFITYMQLVYLEMFDIRQGLASRLTQLLTYDAHFDLPITSIFKYRKEIDEALVGIVRNLTGSEDIQWSLKDILELLVTRDINNHDFKNRFGYKPYRELESFLKNMQMQSKMLGKMYSGLYNMQYFSSRLKKQLTTVSPDMGTCISGLDENKTHYYGHLNCSNEYCSEACHAKKVLSATLKDGKTLGEILYRTSYSLHLEKETPHPSRWLPAIPFCFTGQGIMKLLDSLEAYNDKDLWRDKVPWTNYSMCSSQQVIFTDVGLCTTIGGSNKIFKKFLNGWAEGSTGGGWGPNYPMKAATKQFQAGQDCSLC